MGSVGLQRGEDLHRGHADPSNFDLKFIEDAQVGLGPPIGGMQIPAILHEN